MTYIKLIDSIYGFKLILNLSLSYTKLLTDYKVKILKIKNLKL